DLGKTAADIAHRAVEDDVPRQHVIETLVGERQCVGVGLAQAQSEAPRDSSRRAKSRPAAAPSIASTAKPCSAKSSACRPTPQPRSSVCRAPRAFSTGVRRSEPGSLMTRRWRKQSRANSSLQAQFPVMQGKYRE